MRRARRLGGRQREGYLPKYDTLGIGPMPLSYRERFGRQGYTDGDSWGDGEG